MKMEKICLPLPIVIQKMIVQYMIWGDPEYNLPKWAEEYWKKYYDYTEHPLPSIFIDGRQLLHNPKGRDLSNDNDAGSTSQYYILGHLYCEKQWGQATPYVEYWFLPGTRLYHRINGPAFTEIYGRCQIDKEMYYINGRKLSFKKWLQVKNDPLLWPSKKRKSLKRRYKTLVDYEWKTISILLK